MGFRAALTRILTFLGGLYFFLEFVLPAEIGSFRFDAWHEQITNGFVCVGAMAIGLGLINLLLVHGQKIVFARRGWFNSLALLSGLALMAVAASLDWAGKSSVSRESADWFMLRDFALQIEQDALSDKETVLPGSERNRFLKEAVDERLGRLDLALPAAESFSRALPADKAGRYEVIRQELKAQRDKLEVESGRLRLEGGAEQGDFFTANKSIAEVLGSVGMLRAEMMGIEVSRAVGGRLYSLLYEGLFVSLGSAMFALLGFYIASAAYRAFRIRSLESALMLSAAVLVMLGQIPFGVWFWEDLPSVRLWILSVPNSAAFRAIAIGASVAGLIMAFRMWLSIESKSYGGGQK